MFESQLSSLDNLDLTSLSHVSKERRAGVEGVLALLQKDRPFVQVELGPDAELDPTAKGWELVGENNALLVVRGSIQGLGPTGLTNELGVGYVIEDIGRFFFEFDQALCWSKWINSSRCLEGLARYGQTAESGSRPITCKYSARKPPKSDV